MSSESRDGLNEKMNRSVEQGLHATFISAKTPHGQFLNSTDLSDAHLPHDYIKIYSQSSVKGFYINTSSNVTAI